MGTRGSPGSYGTRVSLRFEEEDHGSTHLALTSSRWGAPSEGTRALLRDTPMGPEHGHADILSIANHGSRPDLGRHSSGFPPRTHSVQIIAMANSHERPQPSRLCCTSDGDGDCRGSSRLRRPVSRAKDVVVAGFPGWVRRQNPPGRAFGTAGYCRRGRSHPGLRLVK